MVYETMGAEVQSLVSAAGKTADQKKDAFNWSAALPDQPWTLQTPKGIFVVGPSGISFQTAAGDVQKIAGPQAAGFIQSNEFKYMVFGASLLLVWFALQSQKAKTVRRKRRK